MSSSLDYFKRLGSPVAALATAPGGPVLVIRVSGRDLSTLRELLGSELPETGTFRLKSILDKNKKLLDHAVVLFFKTPQSFTGEDVVELQIHASTTLSDAIFEHLKILGVEKALPGEFSFRAVMNQKMTLEQAEALNFVLKNEALPVEQSRQLLGLRKIPNQVETLIHELIEAFQKSRGRVEAAIDFPEAEMEQAREISSAKKILVECLEKLTAFQNAYRNFRQAFDTPLVGIVGAPNAGKSTLLNILSGGEKALVSPIAGTTRDLVEVELRLPSGQKFKVVDTAGIRKIDQDAISEGHGGLEEAGILKALKTLEDCRALIWVKNLANKAEDSRLKQKIQELNLPTLLIHSHKDQAHGSLPEASFSLTEGNPAEVQNWIFRELSEHLKKSLDSPSESSHILWLSERQNKDFIRVEELLRTALSSLEGFRPFELVGEDLREAEKTLIGLLGKELGEEYIGQIFSQFCLGK